MATLALVAAACAPSPSTSPPLAATGTPSGSPHLPATALPSSTGSASGDAEVALEIVATGLSTPIAAVAPPDGSGRLFIVEQTGRIWILAGGELLPEPFLDLSSRLVDLAEDYDERGLLGLAFHPGFASNGRFFVYYSAPPGDLPGDVVDHANVLSELRSSVSDPDRADAASEHVLLRFGQPQANHSGGALGFGPDGFLYLGTGDGGGTGDDDPGHAAGGNAQDRTSLSGKVLRLDVNAGRPDASAYGIPPDNPFADGGGAGEVYAWGFRNPWRLAWEPDGARRLLVSDVGYGRYEEVDVVERGGNYGWRVREGAHCLDRAAPLEELAECPLEDEAGTPLTDPVVEYTHRGVGIAVVGGYVYRGAAIPQLAGQYVFADYSSEFGDRVEGHGSLLVAEPQAAAGARWSVRRVAVAALEGITAAANGAPRGQLDVFITGMGEDSAGELYLLVRSDFGPTGDSGQVLRMVPPPG